MNREALEQKLIETLYEIQAMGGHLRPEISGRTCPIKDLEEFDSLTGAEATTSLSMKLKCDFKCGHDDVNVFVSEDGRRALTVNEIVDRLTNLAK